MAAARSRADCFAATAEAVERELAAENAWRAPVPADVWKAARQRAAARPLRGCQVCEAKVDVGRHEPYLVDSVVMQTRLWRCGACGTFWTETQRAVFAITPSEVRSVYQEFRDDGEARAGSRSSGAGGTERSGTSGPDTLNRPGGAPMTELNHAA